MVLFLFFQLSNQLNFPSWLMSSYAVQKPGATSPTSKSGSPKAGATVDGFGWKRGEGPKQFGCYHKRKRSSTGARSRFLVFVNFWTIVNSFPFCCILVSGWKRIIWKLMWVTWHIHKEVMMFLLNCLLNLDFARPKIAKARQKQSENLWFATHLFVVLISAWTVSQPQIMTLLAGYTQKDGYFQHQQCVAWQQ